MRLIDQEHDHAAITRRCQLGHALRQSATQINGIAGHDLVVRPVEEFLEKPRMVVAWWFLNVFVIHGTPENVVRKYWQSPWLQSTCRRR
ncbi:MAG TPA: hypothetical protein VEC06_10780 [Paucimonas sp.]|nr:hypothetical protein [Paucimonas sp.]